MPRAKKDGQHINCYIDRTLCERLKAYADEKGQTMTTALERILKQHFEEENRKTKEKQRNYINCISNYYCCIIDFSRSDNSNINGR